MTLVALENLFRNCPVTDYAYRCDGEGCGAQVAPANQFQCPLLAGWLAVYEAPTNRVQHFCRKCAARRKDTPKEGG